MTDRHNITRRCSLCANPLEDEILHLSMVWTYIENVVIFEEQTLCAHCREKFLDWWFAQEEHHGR